MIRPLQFQIQFYILGSNFGLFFFLCINGDFAVVWIRRLQLNQFLIVFKLL